MAHVQIPAKEDVYPYPIHHAGTQGTPEPVSIEGEGCEVTRSGNAFVIHMRQTEPVQIAEFDASYLLDGLCDLREAHAETSKDLRSKIGDTDISLNIARLRLESVVAHAASLEAKLNILTANQFAARQMQKYFVLAAILTNILSVGAAIWILKV